MLGPEGSGHVPACEALHLPHLCALIGHEPRGQGTGNDGGQIKDANALEKRRQGVGHGRLLLAGTKGPQRER